ncbi:hypothetical protein RYX36_006757 [Vicia faba]
MKWEMELVTPTSYTSNSNWCMEENRTTKWSHEENKLFENALAVYDRDTPDRWHKVAEMIPGKTADDVMRQYKELEDDVCNIEAGLIPVPGYSAPTSPFTLDWVGNSGYDASKGNGKRSSLVRAPEHERKKGVPWTEEEHKLFLLGLKKYGKGDWRNISRNFVVTRTPTQVASHAQKYFIRQLSGGKDKRRASIHDITTVNLTEKIGSCSSEDTNDRSTSPQNSMLLSHQQHQQQSSSSTTTNFLWRNDQQNSMVFNPAHEQVFMPPHGVNSYEIKMEEGFLHESSYPHNMVFQMQHPSQHYSHA